MELKLLKNRDFFLLMQGKFISVFGSILQTFALSLYVLNEYDSATLFASVLIIGLVPSIILGPLAGVFVDWFDRKYIIVILDVCSSVAVLVTAGVYLSNGFLPLSVIYLLTIVLALINTLFSPAISTIIPLLFNKEKLFSANTIDQFLRTIANVLGPIVAGVMLSVTNIGLILIVNGVSYLISAFSEYFIKVPKVKAEQSKLSYKRFKTDFKEGLHFFKEKEVLVQFLVILLLIEFTTAPVAAIALPFYLKKVLLVSDIIYGIFNSIVIIATLFVMIFAGKFTKKYTLEKIIRFDFTVLPICIGTFVYISSPLFLNMFSSNLIPLLISLIIVSIAMMVSTIGSIAIGTLLQRIIPKAKLGRVMTVIGTVTTCAVPLSQGLMGIGMDILPLWLNILFTFCLTTICAVLTHKYIKDHLLMSLEPSYDLV